MFTICDSASGIRVGELVLDPLRDTIGCTCSYPYYRFTFIRLASHVFSSLSHIPTVHLRCNISQPSIVYSLPTWYMVSSFPCAEGFLVFFFFFFRCRSQSFFFGCCLFIYGTLHLVPLCLWIVRWLPYAFRRGGSYFNVGCLLVGPYVPECTGCNIRGERRARRCKLVTDSQCLDNSSCHIRIGEGIL